MAEITAQLVKELREQVRRRHDGLQEGARPRTTATSKPPWTGCAPRASSRPPRRPTASPPRAWSASRAQRRTRMTAVVELNTETDFVARNELFQDRRARYIAQAGAGRRRRVDAITAAEDSARAADRRDLITGLIATIGENMMRAPHGSLRASSRAWWRPMSTTRSPPASAGSACWWR